MIIWAMHQILRDLFSINYSWRNFSGEVWYMEDSWKNVWDMDLLTRSCTHWLLWWYYSKVSHLPTRNAFAGLRVLGLFVVIDEVNAKNLLVHFQIMSRYCVAESWSCRASLSKCCCQPSKQEKFGRWSLWIDLFKGSFLMIAH